MLVTHRVSSFVGSLGCLGCVCELIQYMQIPTCRTHALVYVGHVVETLGHMRVVWGGGIRVMQGRVVRRDSTHGYSGIYVLSTDMRYLLDMLVLLKTTFLLPE